MANNIRKGSNYDNPYAKPAELDPMAKKSFTAFDQGFTQLEGNEIKEDWIAEVQAEFQAAQQRNAQPRPRGKAQDAMMRETQEAATRLAGGNSVK